MNAQNQGGKLSDIPVVFREMYVRVSISLYIAS